jgi:hypothetical protein
MTGKGQYVAPHKSACCIFTADFALLVGETNQYYQQHLDYLHNRPSVPAVTESEILFLVAVIQMGNYI